VWIPRKLPLSLMSKANTVKQIFALLWERKAWWLVPMVVVFLLVGILIVATQGSALSPFIYALF
jgi:NAD/NADP transhydrogenase beta subunit